MSKIKSHYIREIYLNQPDDLMNRVISDWLKKNSYSQVTKNGRTYFQSGDGIITAKDYLIIGYNNGVIHIESWIKIYGSEIGVDDTSFTGIAVKKNVKKKIDDFIDYLSSQAYISSITPQVSINNNSNSPNQYNYTETVNVKTYSNPKAAIAPFVVGIVIFCLDLLLIVLNFIPGWLLIVGSVYGIIASSKAMKLTHNNGMSIAALVINIVAAIFASTLIIVSFIAIFI